MTPLICKAVRFVPEPETATWFDIGQLQDDVGKNSVSIDFFMNLPFERTAIAGRDIHGKEFAIWLRRTDKAIIVHGCVLADGGQYFVPYAYTVEGDGLKMFRKDKEVSLEDVKPVHRMLYAVLLRLQVATDGFIGKPARTFINQKRQAKGKSALTFDWHTVTIEPPRPKNDPQGGTHASPRRHQARGHWRTYKSGKKGWVKECWKGDASKGTVFKDYKLKENND